MSTASRSASAASATATHGSNSSSSAGPNNNTLSYDALTEMYYGVSAFIAVLAAVRVLDLIVTYYRRRQIIARAKLKSASEKQDLEGASTQNTGRVSLRRIPQAILTAFRIAAFRCTLPYGPGASILVSEATAIVGYILGMFLWTFTQTYGPSPKYFVDRAAHVAASQISFVIALAGKNNFVSLFTGISHEKLHVVHRFAGRTLVILIWVHGIGRVNEGVAYTLMEMEWIHYGFAALAAITLAALIAIRPIRTRCYELFLVSHIVLILVFLACCIKHRFAEEYYFYPGFAIWGLDRLIRVGHIFTRNTYWWRSNDKLTTGTVGLASADTVRLTLRRPMTWRPGQHAFVVLPTVSTFPFEAHPFTISSICGDADGKVSGDQELVFLVKCRSGFTRRLRDHATTKGDGEVAAYVDGPYGNPVDLRTYSTSILVAGGAGITYTLPLLLDSVRNARLGQSAVTKILFIWVVRDPESLKMISSRLTEVLTSAPSHLKIETRIYVTRAQNTLPSLSYSEDDVSTPGSLDKGVDDKEKKSSSVTLLSLLKTEIGRPDVNALLQAEIGVATGAVSVDVAGPAALAKAVRSALRGGKASPLAVLKGSPTVSLHVETFGLVGA